MICRAGLAKCWLTAELRNGRLEIPSLRIYNVDSPIDKDATESPIGMLTTIWIEEHLGCEHDKD